ncbi:MAG: hypothetical protein QM270_10800 [Bacillota bacterium]|nr:hypothetical protein [Bacillota bacterium]
MTKLEKLTLTALKMTKNGVVSVKGDKTRKVDIHSSDAAPAPTGQADLALAKARLALAEVGEHQYADQNQEEVLKQVHALHAAPEGGSEQIQMADAFQ